LIAILALFSFAILHVQGIIEFLSVLQISSKGQWFGMKPEAMLNLLGLIIRLIRLDPGITSWIGWLIYLIGIVLLAGLWFRSIGITDRLLGLSILIIVVTAPHLHLHDLTLLIFPLLFIVHERMVTSSESYWMLLPLVGSLLLLFGLLLEVVYFILPYVLFVLLAWLLLDRKQSIWIVRDQDAK
jgi:hypothetical protein